MKHHYLLSLFAASAATIGAATLPVACAKTAAPTGVKPYVQSNALQQKNGKAWRNQEPNQLSWQFFETARAPFADFQNWWNNQPLSRRKAAMAAAKKAGMLQKAPAKETSLYIQGEAFKGEGWKVATVDGCTVLQHSGGHTGSAAKLIVDVPKAGTYRLWSRWWNLPKYHNSFVVHIKPIAAADFKYGWQETVHGDYLNHRFAWQWFHRKNKPPVTYDASKKGLQWESSPMVHLPRGKVLITMSPLISSGPYTARRVDSFLLTQDPLLDPSTLKSTPDSKSGDAASMIQTQENTPSASAKEWQLYDIRPGAKPLSAAPAPLASLWRDWRNGFITRLADGKNLTNVQQNLATRSYFNAQWNLVGTPPLVKKHIAHLQSPNVVVPGFLKWIEAESFHIDSGWKVANAASTGGNKILRATYSNGHAKATDTTTVPKAGKYRLWVRFAQIVKFYNYFEVSVTQNSKTVAEKQFHDTPPKGTRGGYRYYWRPIDVNLQAGKCTIVLTKNIGKGPYAYRMIDAFVLTNNTDYQPDGILKPAHTTVPAGHSAMQEAAQKDEPVAWIAKSHTTPLNSRWTRYTGHGWVPKNSDLWTGFRMTDWPRKSDQIATASAVEVKVQPGAVSNQVLHLTNPTDKPITLSPKFTKGANLASWRVVAYQYQPRYGWQPMPLLRRHQVTIPPHLTASLWLNFDARQSNPGTQKATLTLGKQTINYTIDVTGSDIRKVKAPYVGGWTSPWPNPAGWEFFKDYDLTTVHRVVVPKEQMKKYGIKLFVLVLGHPKDAQRVKDVVSAMKSMGLTYDDWVWEISDEPSPSSAPKWIAAAKDIKAADSKVRIWVNPGEKKKGTPKAIAEMSPYIDVFCPYINHWGVKDPAYQKLLKTLGNPKLMYTTPCFEEKSPAAPMELISLGDSAIAKNRDGWDAFNLRNYYSYASSPWDEVNAAHGAQAISIYPGAWGQVIGSRNMEAVRLAVQRWKTAQLGK